jgi:hypothetical protein
MYTVPIATASSRCRRTDSPEFLLYCSEIPAVQSRFLGDVSGLAEYLDNTVRIILTDVRGKWATK